MATPLLTIMAGKGVGGEGTVPTTWKKFEVRSLQGIITGLRGQDFVLNIISSTSFYQELAQANSWPTDKVS